MSTPFAWLSRLRFRKGSSARRPSAARKRTALTKRLGVPLVATLLSRASIFAWRRKGGVHTSASANRSRETKASVGSAVGRQLSGLVQPAPAECPCQMELGMGLAAVRYRLLRWDRNFVWAAMANPPRRNPNGFPDLPTKPAMRFATVAA